MKYRCLILLSLLAAANLHAGGGWTLKKGTGFYKLSQWWVIADQHYTNTGGIDPNGTRGTFNTSLYAEYGISDRFNGIVYFPFFSRSVLYEQVSATTGEVIAEGDAVNSIGDTDVSFKYGLIQNKPIVLSATLTLGLPLGKAEGGRDGSLQTGDGEFNQMIALDVSRSFVLGSTYPYLSAYVGFNNRTNGYSDEFIYGVETGITIKKFTGIVRLFGVQSFNNGDPTFNSQGTSLFSNNREYLSFSPELSYSFSSKWGISSSYGGAAQGRLIFARPSYSFGIYLKT